MSGDIRIDQICDHYESAWNSGQRPDLRQLIEEVPGEYRDDVLHHLIELNIELRIRDKQTPKPEDYIELGPMARKKAEHAIRTFTSGPEAITPAIPDAGLTLESTVTPDKEQKLTESQLLDVFQKATQVHEMSPVVGPYKIFQKIGSGGMGIVFMAEQTQPVRRRVALKLIRAGMDTKEVITRFEAERQALAMMDHPHIAKVLDAGTTSDGRPYFVMELVQGIPITDYSDRYKLSIEDRLSLLMQTCRAIQHAHQKGIIHRDIKPSNVLVTQHDGQPSVKVIDFGLAKALQAATRLTDRTMFTEFGQVVGTFQYMSPEQAELNALDVDTRSDVYSLGVMLYELLTGNTPIEKQRITKMAIDRILVAIREEEIQRPSLRLSSLGDSARGISEQRRTDPGRLGGLLKGDLDWITVKALEKDRSRRYDSPAQLAEDIQRFLVNEPIAARPPAVTYRLGKLIRKNKLASISLLGGLILGTTAIAAMGLAWINSDTLRRERLETLRENAVRSEREAEEGRKRIAQLTELTDALQIKTKELLNKTEESEAAAQKAREAQATAVREQQEADRAKAEAEASKQIATDAAKSLEKINAELLVQKSAAEQAARTAENARIVSERNAEAARVAGIQATKERNRAVSAKQQTTATLARSNFFLAVSMWNNARAQEAISALMRVPVELRDIEWNLMRRRIEKGVVTLHGVPSTTNNEDMVTFSPDGRFVLAQVNQKELWQFDSNNYWSLRKVQHKNSPSTFAGTKFRFPRRDDGWSYCFEEGFLTHFQTNTLRYEPLPPITTESTFSLDLHPDRQIAAIAAVDQDREIQLLDLRSRKVIRVLSGHTNLVVALSFSPDGTQLLSGGYDRNVILWDVNSGQKLHELLGSEAVVNNVCFSPDGRHCYAAGEDSAIRIWEAKTGQLLHTLWGHQDGIESIAASPDGRYVLSGGRDATVRLWDVKNGKQLRTLTGHDAVVQAVAFSPDGRHCLSRSWDHTIRIWDLSDTEEERIVDAHTDRSVRNLAFLPDGTRLISNGEDGSIRVWDTVSGQVVQESKMHASCIAVSRDGSRLVVGSHDGQIDVRQTASLETELSVRHAAVLAAESFEFQSAVTYVAISADNRWLAASSDAGSVQVWATATGQSVCLYPAPGERILGLTFSEDGQTVAYLNEQMQLTEFRVARNPEGRSIRGPIAATLNSAAFDSTSQKILVGSFDGRIAIWDPQTGLSKSSSTRHTFRLRRGEFASYYNGGVDALTFDRTGRRAFSAGGDGDVKLWDLNTGEELWNFHGHRDGASAVALSPDGTMLVTGDLNGNIRFWSCSPQNNMKFLNGSLFEDGRPSFSDDGRTVRTWIPPGTTLYWDTETGQQLAELPPHIAWASGSDSTTSPDGRWSLMSTGGFVGLVDHKARRPAWTSLVESSEVRATRWHSEQAQSAEAAGDWYAAAFHLAWLQKNSSPNSERQTRLQAAWQELVRQAGEKPLSVAPLIEDMVKRR